MANNPAYRAKARLQLIALAALDDETFYSIVCIAAQKARTGELKAIKALTCLMQVLGIDKVDPDMQGIHELKTIMGNPTPAMIKRMRPNAAPRIVNNNDEQVG